MTTCPGCGTTMTLHSSGGTILKRTGRGVVGAILGSVVPGIGTAIGFVVGASRRGKNDSVYWACPKCGYYRFLTPGEMQS
jgi:ribosomal protein S27AE